MIFIIQGANILRILKLLNATCTDCLRRLYTVSVLYSSLSKIVYQSYIFERLNTLNEQHFLAIRSHIIEYKQIFSA